MRSLGAGVCRSEAHHTRNGHLAPQGTGQLAPHKLPALHAQIVRLTGGMGYLPPQLGHLAWRGLKG